MPRPNTHYTIVFQISHFTNQHYQLSVSTQVNQSPKWLKLTRNKKKLYITHLVQILHQLRFT